MPTVAKFTFIKDISRQTVNKAKAQMRTYAIANFQRPLQRIVDPFLSDIRIVTRVKSTGDKYTVTVKADDRIVTSNRLGGPILSSKIFEYLNSGTEQRAVGMPKDYQAGTTPGSLSSSGANYDRERLYFLDEPIDGIEARNWTQTLVNQRIPATERLMKKVGRLISDATLGA